MTEYIDDNDGYIELEREYVNDAIDKRIYCREHYHNRKGCNIYIKGTEYYNGMFISEDGEMYDLRNKEFICDEHYNELLK